MAEIGLKELLEAGVHFGHQTRRWNPKMRRFIHGERGGIYLIDLLKTQALLNQAQAFATEIAHRGGTVLFVGTKKQARDGIKEIATAANMPYVNHRWLGGLLTNYQTMSARIKRLHDLERYQADGQLSLLPTRERLSAEADLLEAAGQPGRRQEHDPRAGRDVRDRPQDRGDRRARGPAPAHPDHRPGRHERRPGRHRLRHPGQRRRDPRLQHHHAGDRRRGPAGPRALPLRGGAGARRGRRAAAARGRGARSAARRRRRPPPRRPSVPPPRRRSRRPARASRATSPRPRWPRPSRPRRPWSRAPAPPRPRPPRQAATEPADARGGYPRSEPVPSRSSRRTRSSTRRARRRPEDEPAVEADAPREKAAKAKAEAEGRGARAGPERGRRGGRRGRSRR